MIKRIILIIAIFFAAFQPNYAQMKDKGFFVQAFVGMGDWNRKIYFTGESRYRYYALATPGIGYRFSKRWSAGFDIKFPIGINREYDVIPTLFAEYDFISLRRLKITAGACGSYGDFSGTIDCNPFNDIPNCSSWSKLNLWEVGIYFGASYNLSSKLALMVRYACIGYYDTTPFHFEDTNGFLHSGHFMADFSLRRLQIGARFTF